MLGGLKPLLSRPVVRAVVIALVTGIAVSIGLVLVNLLQPGGGLPPEVGQQLLASGSGQVSEIAAKLTCHGVGLSTCTARPPTRCCSDQRSVPW